MKIKYVLVEKRPLDGLPRFTVQGTDYIYLSAVGQTKAEALARFKAKLEEDFDRNGIIDLETGEIEVP